MRILMLAGIISIISFTLKSQSYTTSAGVRIGLPYGISGKHFFTKYDAMEVLVTGFAESGLSFNYQATFLYERHLYPFNIDGVALYYGGGGHVGIFHSGLFPDGRPNFGADLIGGVEYTFPNSPLNISADIKPSVSFFDPFRFYYNRVALTVRYILKY